MAVIRYVCGHVGRKNLGHKVEAFIRVAEIREPLLENPVEKCPDCKARMSGRES